MTDNWRCSCVLQVCFVELIHFAITVAYVAMKHVVPPSLNFVFPIGIQTLHLACTHVYLLPIG